MRSPWRIRWWCTAPVASSDGMGSVCTSALSSLMIRMCAPHAHRVFGLAAERSTAARRAAPPPLLRRHILPRRRLPDRIHRRRAKFGSLALRSAAICSGLSTGDLSSISARRFGRLAQQVGAAAQQHAQAHHHLLAQRVDGRVGHFGKALLEVAEERARQLAHRGGRRVVAHARPPAPGRSSASGAG